MATYKLRELISDFKMLEDMLSDPEIDEECLLDSWESLQATFEVKVDNTAKVLDNFDDKLAAVKREKDRLDAYEKHITNRKRWLEGQLKYAMETTGNTKLDLGTRKVSVVKNGGQEPLIIDGDVPNEYYTRKIIDEVNKNKIRDDLKNGVVLDFAHLGERGTHLKY